jgi:mannan endo-1,4-beta-mannosidase
LDFANIHIYQEGTIDFPQDTVAPALDMGRIVAESIAQMDPRRPFFDSEHGPIHTFKDHGVTLPAAFDAEYFRNMQWAHLASGGVGGGMRWPNRWPHVLTAGMHKAQRAMAGFLPLVDWSRFRRTNISAEVTVTESGTAAFGCRDDEQAIVWLLRTGPLRPDGRLDTGAPPRPVTFTMPGLRTRPRVTAWDTVSGRVVEGGTADLTEGGTLQVVTPAFAGNIALALRSATT